MEIKNIADELFLLVHPFPSRKVSLVRRSTASSRTSCSHRETLFHRQLQGGPRPASLQGPLWRSRSLAQAGQCHTRSPQITD